MRYEVRRVHGWKTWRVMDTEMDRWHSEPFSTQEEAFAASKEANDAYEEMVRLGRHR